MAQKYYNSAETAKILGKSVDDVKQMLERRELHGYRDGADWKFKTEDVERIAKDRAENPPAAAGDEDQSDVLLSEVALGQADPGASGTVIGMESPRKTATDSDLQLASSDVRLAESDVKLGAETPAPKSAPASAPKSAPKSAANPRR